MLKIGVLHPDEDEATLSERFAQIQFDQFDFLLWSKTKVKERDILKAGQKAAAHAQGDAKAKAEAHAIEEELLKAFKKRFEKTLPLQNVNLIFVQSSATEVFFASHQTSALGGGTSVSHHGDMEHHE